MFDHRSTVFSRFAILLSLVVSTCAWAQDNSSNDSKADTEVWQGTLDVAPTTSLRLQFKLSQGADKKWTGQMISVDQGGAVVPLDSVEIDDTTMHLTIKKVKVDFRGEFNKDHTQVTGTLSQFGRSFKLTLQPTTLAKNLKHVETWQGTMTAGPQRFEFQIRVFQSDDGRFSAMLDSFSESLMNLAVDLKTHDDAGIEFELPLTKASYAGKYNSDHTKIDGQWQQNGQSFPLVFNKIKLEDTKEPIVKRPQNPKKPYPYRDIDVEFDNSADNVHLMGTLTLPKATGRYPAAILITGSGPQDRDESLLGHKPFLVLADHLTRAGFAVLRYDERGVGKSTGDFSMATSEDLARDVSAAVDFLKTQDEVDPSQIGLIGHSEGGYIAPMVATQRNDIAFVVMMAGPGVPGSEIIPNQTELISRAAGASDEDIRKNIDLLKQIIALATSDKPKPEIKAAIKEMTDKLSANMTDAERKATPAEALSAQMEGMMLPWFRFFLTYDPRPALKAIKCPVLVLNGSKDLQVDPKLNLPEIKKAFESVGKKNYEIVELENLNHLFQTCKTGSPSEYRGIEETIAPVAMDTITKFMQKHCHSNPQ